jgi:hypothetical protein
LIRLREAAARDPKLRFTNLLHHIDIELLEEAYRALNRNAKVATTRTPTPKDDISSNLSSCHE